MAHVPVPKVSGTTPCVTTSHFFPIVGWFSQMPNTIPWPVSVVVVTTTWFALDVSALTGTGPVIAAVAFNEMPKVPLRPSTQPLQLLSITCPPPSPVAAPLPPANPQSHP